MQVYSAGKADVWNRDFTDPSYLPQRGEQNLTPWGQQTCVVLAASQSSACKDSHDVQSACI